MGNTTLPENHDDEKTLVVNDSSPTAQFALSPVPINETDGFDLNLIEWPLPSNDATVRNPVKMPIPSSVMASSETTTSVVLLNAKAVPITDEPVTSPASIADAWLEDYDGKSFPRNGQRQTRPTNQRWILNTSLSSRTPSDDLAEETVLNSSADL